RDDAAHVEKIADDLRLGARIALDRLQPTRVVGAVPTDTAQQGRPSQNCVQRRPQLMGQGSEELVLHTAQALSLGAGRALGTQQLIPVELRLSIFGDIDAGADISGEASARTLPEWNGCIDHPP